jgi:hypothetical protein
MMFLPMKDMQWDIKKSSLKGMLKVNQILVFSEKTEKPVYQLRTGRVVELNESVNRLKNGRPVKST